MAFKNGIQKVFWRTNQVLINQNFVNQMKFDLSKLKDLMYGIPLDISSITEGTERYYIQSHFSRD